VESLILETGLSDEFQNDVELDAKSALQELAQSRKLPIPRYSDRPPEGPEHAKLFIVEARVGKQFAARARGSIQESRRADGGGAGDRTTGATTMQRSLEPRAAGEE